MKLEVKDGIASITSTNEKEYKLFIEMALGMNEKITITGTPVITKLPQECMERQRENRVRTLWWNVYEHKKTQ